MRFNMEAQTNRGTIGKPTAPVRMSEFRVWPPNPLRQSIKGQFRELPSTAKRTTISVRLSKPVQKKKSECLNLPPPQIKKKKKKKQEEEAARPNPNVWTSPPPQKKTKTKRMNPSPQETNKNTCICVWTYSDRTSVLNSDTGWPPSAPKRPLRPNPTPKPG